MSERIVQHFGIDAAQALATLRQLDQGFASWEARIRSTADALQKLNSGPARQVDKLGAAFKSNMPEAVKQTERLTTSLGLLSRIVFTQAIIRGLSQVRRTLERTGEAAVEFQRAIARTVTIADGAKFDEIAGQVRRLSDEFNIPLLETAEAVYNALSNQVGDFGQSVKFAEEAARFAKATNSSLSDSVDLLSAALKGYGLGVEDVDKVSSIFFATIDKGRINASELANSFGRVDTIAADLGVSLETTGAALAAISVRGTKTSEALTQFRAILSALQKPSKAMRKALEEIGFTSAEVAIKTLTLPGVLDALAKSTGGSAEQLAKLFPNIRGLSGASSLLSDDLTSLADNIEEMTTAGRDFNREKFLEATATDAERVTKELNKLKNELTVNLGQATLSAADDLFKFTGGAENLIATGKVAVPTIAAVAAAMLALKAQTALANAELTVLSKALGALGLAAVAVGVGSSIGQFIENKRLESLFKDLRTLEAADQKFLADFERRQGEQRDEFNRTNEARVQAALQSNLELARIYNQDVENAKTAAQRKAAFEKFKSRSAVDENALGALLKRKLDSPDQVARGIIDAQKKTAELKAKLDQAVAGEQGIDRLRGNLDELFQELDQRQASRAVVGGDRGEGLRGQFANVLNLLKDLRTDANITEEELAKVIEFRNSLGQDVFAGGGLAGTGLLNIDKAAFASTLNALDAALLKIQAIKQLQAGIGDQTSIANELHAFQALLEQAAPDVAFQSAADALFRSVTPANQIADAMERAAKASSQVGSLQFRAQGGTAHFADGGRGTDTVPAMLTPGETVIDAANSRKFFSQIQAIRAGQPPIFRQDGGTVNNQTIGDIHVTAARNPDSTARAVVDKIRREQRRGTIGGL